MYKQWVCDLETWSDTNHAHIWIWGACSIDDELDFIWGHNINDLMEWIFKQKSIYFHNLKYDGGYIVDWLLKEGFRHSTNRKLSNREFGTLISSAGKWYELKIRNNGNTVTIRDSFKKLPFSVRRIGRSFGLGTCKGELDYSVYRSENHEPTDNELDYLHRDCKIVAQALKIQFDQGLTKLTIGSDSLTYYKSIQPNFKYYFPSISNNIDAAIRRSYKGGYCYLHKPGEHGETIVLDVNSLYPFAMTMPLPYGEPVYFRGEYKENTKYPLYITMFYADFTLKEGFLPTVQLKKSGYHMQTEYVTDSKGKVEVVMTSVDYEIFRRHYNVHDIDFVDGYMFKSVIGVFDNYINYWMHIKANNKGAIRELAKLMLNNLYGKFAKHPDVTGKIPTLDNNKIKLVKGVEENAETVYIPVGTFITANARSVTINAAQNNYDRFIYGDTDSLHLSGTSLPEELDIHESKLGAWDHEYTSIRSRYIRQKRYITYPIKGSRVKRKVACAGLPDNCKTRVSWRNFHIGKSYMGKLVPKYVEGGVHLEETTFTLD